MSPARRRRTRWSARPGTTRPARAFGGSCYLNNAAVAAQALRDRGPAASRSSTSTPTTATARRRSSTTARTCFYASLHVDPGAGWFPHFVGFADERGRGAGAGATINCPLAPGTGDEGWLDALDELLSVVGNHTPDALVVSLGVDAAGVDPESPLEVSTDGFHGAGERLAALRLPTVLVHEGGYELARLGVDTVAVLSAFESGES